MSLLKLNNIIALGMIAFLVMSFWTLFSMPMDKDGRMVDCPFMNGSTGFCQMTLTEHISLWQETFSLIKVKNFLLAAVSLLVLLFFVAFVSTQRTYYQLKSQPFRNYIYKYSPEIKLFDHLLIAFSNGLIHSKIYA